MRTLTQLINGVSNKYNKSFTGNKLVLNIDNTFVRNSAPVRTFSD